MADTRMKPRPVFHCSLVIAFIALVVSKLDIRAASLPRLTNSLGMIFVSLPAGEFVMGTPEAEAEAMAAWMRENKINDWYPNSPPSETPQRRVALTRSFAMCAHETRLADFRAFVAETGYKTDAEKDGKGGDGKSLDGRWVDAKPQFNWGEMGYARSEDEPVVNVSWNDAVAFCEWLSKKESMNYRLPTEAEWEYACRAGTKTAFFWGNDEAKRNDYVWSGANSGSRPHSVMTRQPNGWGLYDMNGNVYEYTSNWWSTNVVTGTLLSDPAGPAHPGAERWVVLRSGSWGTNPKHCRSAFRGGATRDHRNRRDGFRVVREFVPSL